MSASCTERWPAGPALCRELGSRRTVRLEHEAQAVGVIGSLERDNVRVVCALENLGQRGELRGGDEGRSAASATRPFLSRARGKMDPARDEPGERAQGDGR